VILDLFSDSTNKSKITNQQSTTIPQSKIYESTMPVLTNIGLLATCREEGGQDAIHTIPQAALAWRGTDVTWVGPAEGLPNEYRDEERIDAEGRLVVPGLIDCHTHLAFAGWRADEIEARIRGRTYLEVAAAGGGIVRTVAATRKASTDMLVERCARWLAEMVRLGITTVEAKTGYGLDVENEIRVLEVYQALRHTQPVRLVSTLLAAHVVPPEYAGRREPYIEMVCSDLIPLVAGRGLARFCDVFVEESAFTPDEARTVLRHAGEHALGAKLHVDQFTDGDGAALAAELKAVSADHLECVSADGIARLARAGTVAVTLPVAALYLGRPSAPARSLIAAGVPVAVATDFNPGTAPTFHLPLAMLLAATLQRMTPAEVLKGVTIRAARAIGEASAVGSLEPGKRADFAIIDAPDVNHWIYHFAPNSCVSTYIGGVRVHSVADCDTHRRH
jgi:imidazolonepropionase